MSLSFGQILIILVVGFLLFGNLPLRIKELKKSLSEVQEEFKVGEKNQDKKLESLYMLLYVKKF